MIAYLVRRVAGMFILLFLISVAVFFLFNLLPGDPARLTCGKACTPVVVEQNRKRLGYDKPPVEQYLIFVKGIFFGRVFSESSPVPVVCNAPCLGYSYTRHQQVLSLIQKAAPVTFFLAIGAFLLWIFAGLSLGIVAALNRGRWVDRLIMGISLIGYSLPSFFIGLVLLFFVVIKWQFLPYPNYISPFENPVQFFQTMLLPWIVLATLTAAFYMRLTRNQVLEVFGDDYVRTARAKGLPERTVVVKHALRAGLTPIVTAAGLDLAYLLGGAIISENIFSLPGLGALAVNSVVQSDLPLITGITLLTATIIIFANLIVDLLYAVVDPRVRIT
ncbi:MAG: ABC transporter permease [Chloroflexi bacterium]|nr:MAG: ABC transporter permease [Chloroflexota bacterium]